MVRLFVFVDLSVELPTLDTEFCVTTGIRIYYYEHTTAENQPKEYSRLRIPANNHLVFGGTGFWMQVSVRSVVRSSPFFVLSS